jgi:hypothetical protein
VPCERRQRIAFGAAARLRGLPHLGEEVRHGVRRAGHPVFERVLRVVVVAVQARLLVAQRQDLAGDPVGCRARRRARRASSTRVRLLAQVAPLREREERHDQAIATA